MVLYKRVAATSESLSVLNGSSGIVFGLFQVSEALLHKIYPNKLGVDAHGFAGENKDGTWCGAGPQRKAMAPLTKQLVLGNIEDASNNFKAIEVAFEHQLDTGAISGKPSLLSRVGRVSEKDQKSAAVSASFFLSEAAFTMLLIENAQGDQWAPLKERVALIKPKVSRLLAYLSQDEGLAHITNDCHHTNRIFFHAKALFLGGCLVGDEQAKLVGASFLNKGLSEQQPNGVFPEGKGFDTSYQMVSCMKLVEFAIAAELGGHPEYINQILPAVTLGVEWELGKITDGEVSDFGNRRTAKNPVTKVEKRMIQISSAVSAKTMSAAHAIGDNAKAAVGKARTFFDVFGSKKTEDRLSEVEVSDVTPTEEVPQETVDSEVETPRSKKMNYMEIARSLVLCGVVLRRPEIVTIGEAVIDKAKQEKAQKEK